MTPQTPQTPDPQTPFRGLLGEALVGWFLSWGGFLCSFFFFCFFFFTIRDKGEQCLKSGGDHQDPPDPPDLRPPEPRHKQMIVPHFKFIFEHRMGTIPFVGPSMQGPTELAPQLNSWPLAAQDRCGYGRGCGCGCEAVVVNPRLLFFYRRSFQPIPTTQFLSLQTFTGVQNGKRVGTSWLAVVNT